MQNSFGPRNAAMFCISTKTAPCAKPSQKFMAAVPIALPGVAVQSSTKSAVVAGPKFASVAACAAKGARIASAAAAVNRLIMTPFPLYAADIIAEQTQLPQNPLRFRKPSEIECGCLGLIVPKLCSTSQLT
jgi:hypothetical protein